MAVISVGRADSVLETQIATSQESAGSGYSSPLGATVLPGGVNFSVYSRTATSVELLLFDQEEAAAIRTIKLDASTNRAYPYWHVFVPGLKPGQLYGYRVQGPFDAAVGNRFDGAKVLLDPYGLGLVVPRGYSRDAAHTPGDNAATAMKSVVVDASTYDWEGDAPLNRPASRTIIYEMHVRGFTRHPNSKVPETKRGTYAGVIEKIPYLRQLGITAVELLPIFQFDAQDAPRGLVNYWGYSPVSFFAPHRAYSSCQGALGPIDEFRDMVKALHRAGIEVILDVVFNHTAEGNEEGPTLSLRGFENGVYYILERDRSRYANYSGTGNTLNANHSVVRRLIVDSLHYWVQQMHVDGFRFDLASILGRDQSGSLLPNPPVIWDIDSDPVLANTKLIAEAWDAAGLYQVGNFAGEKWREWNGRFRDDMRSFFRGDEGSVNATADRLVGSPQIYAHKEREAEESINFITCHDGFTVNDLVSYERKHNEANREDNRDGVEENKSNNYGIEGPSDDPVVDELRNRQVKNFFAVTMIALGLPMILMGDEVRRTQNGNNNAWCQDNETSWFDWSLLSKHADVHRFLNRLNAHRLMSDWNPGGQRQTLNQLLREGDRAWHGVKLGQPDWGAGSHSLAYSVRCRTENLHFYLILNAFWEPLQFELPAPHSLNGLWHRWIDTALCSPDDIVDWPVAPSVANRTYSAEPRSVVALFARTATK